jgi:hypothetical protein
MPYNPTPDELEKGLVEVHYEIQQLAATTAKPLIKDAVLNNAVWESRLLHVRALIDFFEKSSSPKDDILAAHYGFPEGRLAIDKSYQQRLHKDLAHLTYTRTTRTVEEQSWPYEQVAVPVLECCQLFIDHILNSHTTFFHYRRDHWERLTEKVAEAITAMTKQQGP